MSNKIVLFTPDPQKNYYWARIPLSVIATAALLPGAGYKVIVLTTKDAGWKKRLKEELKDSLLLGLTTMTGYQIQGALDAAKIAREINPSLPIVFGGWHPTILPLQTIQHPLVDIVVKGQGEKTLLELADALASQKDLAGVDGILFKKNGQIISNKERAPTDLNELPYTPYGLIDAEQYIYRSEFGARTLNYITSRGCPHRCKFCAELVTNKRHWVGLKPERVLDELEQLIRRYHLDALVFEDSNFFVNPARAAAICEGMIKRKFNVKWGNANVHAKDILKYDDATWKLMVDSGLSDMLVGAESPFDSVLEAINKDATVADVINLRKKCAQYDVRLILSFLVGTPLATELGISIREEIMATVDLIYKCYQISKNQAGKIFFYTPFPGTPMYEGAKKYGFREPTSLEESSSVELDCPHLSTVTDADKKLLAAVNFSWPYLYETYARSKENKGYHIVKGKTGLRRMVFNILDFIGGRCSILRWKFKFFRFPIEQHAIQAVFRLKNNLEKLT